MDSHQQVYTDLSTTTYYDDRRGVEVSEQALGCIAARVNKCLDSKRKVPEVGVSGLLIISGIAESLQLGEEIWEEIQVRPPCMIEPLFCSKLLYLCICIHNL